MAEPKTQTYSNHAYRPIASIIAFLLATMAIVAAFRQWLAGSGGDAFALLCVSLAVFVLALISRTYTTRLQDRIIRLEMRLRLKELLPRERHGLIDTLTPAQMVALRFASDGELPGLAGRAAAEGLSRADIKKAIKDWQADWMRT